MATAETAAKLNQLPTLRLLPALRELSDPAARRQITEEVHELRLVQWRQKRSYKHSHARRLVEGMHLPFRRAFKALLSNPGTVDVRAFRSVNRDLHGHHGFEDAHVFPSMRSAHPELAAELDILEADHAHLVSLERKVEQGSYEALAEFVACLDDHLNREEFIIVPLYLEQ